MSERDRLHVVLRLREIEERRAEATAARAATAARGAAAARGEARQRYEARPAPQGELSAPQLRALQLQGEGALERYHEALRRAEDAATESRGAQDALSMAASRRRSVERLTERRSAEAARAAQVAADRALDELVLLSRASWR